MSLWFLTPNGKQVKEANEVVLEHLHEHLLVFSFLLGGAVKVDWPLTSYPHFAVVFLQCYHPDASCASSP